MAANAENVENLPPGYYARLCEGKDQEWVDEYVHAKYPASDRGSVYGPLIQVLKDRGGLTEFECGMLVRHLASELHCSICQLLPQFAEHRGHPWSVLKISS